MRKARGYSLAEVLTVILIVGVLAAIAIPLMRGFVDSARWSEGRARAGMIATAIRAWIAGYNMPVHGPTHLEVWTRWSWGLGQMTSQVRISTRIILPGS